MARQVAALGAKVTLAGVIGADAAGDDLLRLCAAWRHRHARRGPRGDTDAPPASCGCWATASSCCAWIGRTPAPATRIYVRRMLAGLAREVPDAVILSDYAKGVLTAQLITAITARAGKVPVVVDPKSRDFTRYRGATTVTPNLRELELAAGKSVDPTDSDAVAAAARPLIAAAGLASMVVTLSEHGMLAVPAAGPAVAVPASRRAVFDVTGAGDTVIAVLALSLAAKASLSDAAKLANAAAGVVSRPGRCGRRGCGQHPR